MARCSGMDELQVTKLNVPSTFETNVCRLKPAASADLCSKGTHGMLLGLSGSTQKSLYTDAEIVYRDSIVASAGAGLFLQGGNPIYYTFKGSADELANEALHAVLRSHKDDLGGHHVVLRLEIDQSSGDPILRVDRLPLTSPGSSSASQPDYDRSAQDPVEFLYEVSKYSFLQPGGNNGWLQNLPGNMRFEQAKVDELYPPPTQKYNAEGQWSCPLLRIAFWSQVVEGFSPLVPSPVRAALLFGHPNYNMIHGTRSHPTQEFRSLYSRLANVHTSNGFCYCLDVEQCQVKHNAGGECTLLETLQSLYDQKFRTATVLTNSTSVCKASLPCFPFLWFRLSVVVGN